MVRVMVKGSLKRGEGLHSNKSSRGVASDPPWIACGQGRVCHCIALCRLWRVGFRMEVWGIAQNCWTAASCCAAMMAQAEVLVLAIGCLKVPAHAGWEISLSSSHRDYTEMVTSRRVRGGKLFQAACESGACWGHAWQQQETQYARKQRTQQSIQAIASFH